MTEELRVSIRVKPGSSRARVGGAHGDRLVVAVNARAVDGAATQAALRALGEAFGVRGRDMHLVTGVTSRDKVVAFEVPDDDAAARLRDRLATLLAAT